MSMNNFSESLTEFYNCDYDIYLDFLGTIRLSIKEWVTSLSLQVKMFTNVFCTNTVSVGPNVETTIIDWMNKMKYLKLLTDGQQKNQHILKIVFTKI